MKDKIKCLMSLLFMVFIYCFLNDEILFCLSLGKDNVFFLFFCGLFESGYVVFYLMCD